MIFNGFKIIPHPMLRPYLVSKQFRFPKTKKKRIRKKWAKKPENYKMVSEDKGIIIGDTVFVSQQAFDRLSEKSNLL